MTTLTSSARRSSREGRVSVSGSRGLPPVCLSVSVSRQQPIPTHSKTEIECTVCAASTGACTDRVNRYNTLERDDRDVDRRPARPALSTWSSAPCFQGGGAPI